jgi:uncharacterized protein YgfB (UPF0149 family)
MRPAPASTMLFAARNISKLRTGSDTSKTGAKRISQAKREASRARSDAEFCSKLDGLLQEGDESQVWLELLYEDCHISGEQIDFLLKETSELLAIFTTIVSRVRKNL